MTPKPRNTHKDMPQRVYWKNGQWRYMVPSHLKNYIPGRKTWVNLGKDKQTALMKYAELMGSLNKQSGMSKLFNRYKAEVIPNKATRTQKDNLQELKKLEEFFGDMHPSEVLPVHCGDYLDLRGKQSKTQANHEFALLSHIFNKAMRWGIINSNPCKGIEKHKTEARDRYVEDWELDAFLSCSTPFIRAYVDVRLATGLRQGDMLSMSVRDITDSGIKVKTNKTRRKGLIEWTPELKAAVNRLMCLNKIQGMTVICNSKGQPLSRYTFGDRWRKVMEKALKETKLEERFTENDLRAKHATDVDEMGGDATTNLLHDDPRTTRIYLRSKKAKVIKPFVKHLK